MTKAARGEHPIVVLWSHPRSMSTALERVMRERGDFHCFHEPFMYFHYLLRRCRVFPHFDVDPDHPVEYEAIREMLLERAKLGPVFVKDMSYYVVERMRDDERFARRLTNTFLIRDPARSIVSYHRLDSDFSLEEVGLEAQCMHFRWLTALLGGPPALIDAQDLQADPGGTLRAYCAAIGVEFRPESLEFRKPPPADWGPVSGWHAGVSGATGIASGGRASGSVDPGPVLAQDARLRSFHEHHLPFYRELRGHRLRPAR